VPDSVQVKLREGDSSRGIGISLYVFTPEREPAILDLRIQALHCFDDSRCANAHIKEVVRYPDGGPVVPDPAACRAGGHPARLRVIA
jgi:hypothetical protein